MGMTALDRFRVIAREGSSLAPVHSEFGTLLDHAEPGHVRAHIPALPPTVLRGVGPVPVLADLVLSGAMSTTLPAGSYVTTLTMHVSMLGRLPPEGAPLLASGLLTAADVDSAVGTAEITDADGRPVAVMTSRCATVTDPDGPGRPLLDRRPVAAPFDALAPRTDLDGGAVVVQVTAAPSMANAGGAVQGGVLAALAAHALDAAIGAANPQLAGGLCDLDVAFLRGVPADGATFTVRAEVARAGSRFASARAEVQDAAGRLAVTAMAAQWRRSRQDG
ncbi:MAG: hypothetical protein QOG20_6456 [Pseudonocardiales bacterium]|nr:hypothetical protein [Pseudonocardiales bacterium]